MSSETKHPLKLTVGLFSFFFSLSLTRCLLTILRRYFYFSLKWYRWQSKIINIDFNFRILESGCYSGQPPAPRLSAHIWGVSKFCQVHWPSQQIHQIGYFKLSFQLFYWFYKLIPCIFLILVRWIDPIFPVSNEDRLHLLQSSQEITSHRHCQYSYHLKNISIRHYKIVRYWSTLCHGSTVTAALVFIGLRSWLSIHLSKLLQSINLSARKHRKAMGNSNFRISSLNMTIWSIVWIVGICQIQAARVGAPNKVKESI